VSSSFESASDSVEATSAVFESVLSFEEEEEGEGDEEVRSEPVPRMVKTPRPKFWGERLRREAGDKYHMREFGWRDVRGSSECVIIECERVVSGEKTGLLASQQEIGPTYHFYILRVRLI